MSNTKKTPKVFVEFKENKWDREYDYFHRRHKAWFQGQQTVKYGFGSVQEAHEWIAHCVEQRTHSKPIQEYKINTERAFMKFAPYTMSDYRIAFEG